MFGFKSYPLHQAAESSNTKRLAELLETYLKQNQLSLLEQWNENKTTPLCVAYSSQQFENMILLLESGCKPHTQSAPHYTIAHNTIAYGYLGLFRLVLWFDPDFDNITNHKGITARERLPKWVSKSKGFPINDVIQKTLNDANKVKEILTQIEIYQRSGNFSLEQAKLFNALGEIYLQHHALELSTPFMTNELLKADENQQVYDKSKGALLHFYLNKALEYYQHAARVFSGLNLDSESKKVYYQILTRLIEITGQLGLPSKVRTYLDERLRLENTSEIKNPFTFFSQSGSFASTSSSSSQNESSQFDTSDEEPLLGSTLTSRKRGNSRGNSLEASPENSDIEMENALGQSPPKTVPSTFKQKIS